MSLAGTILVLVGGYAGVGVIFAIWFVFKGAGLIDPVARTGPLGFRLLIMPGSAALWPLLFLRCLRTQEKDLA